MTPTMTLGAKLAVAAVAMAFIVSLVPVFVFASDAIPPGAVDVGAPATTSFNPAGDPSVTVEGGAALGALGAMPWAWALVLLAVLGAIAWGVYRYSAHTLP